MKKELLRIDNGSVDTGVYGSLNDIYLHVLAGQTMAVVFADLHEKNTFLHMLQGELPLRRGRVYLNETRLNDASAIRGGVYVIHKTSALMSQLKIWENVFYAQLPPFVFRRQLYREMLQDIMDQFNMRIDPDTSVAQLDHAETVQIELLKAYVMKRYVIVLADISYYLTGMEMEAMIVMMRRMKEYGYSFILIDSTRELLMKNADLFCFIRQGRTCGFFEPSELDDVVFQRILWQGTNMPETLSGEKRFVDEGGEGKVFLEFRRVGAGTLSDIRFSLHRGKLLKIFYQKEKDGDTLLSLLRGEQEPEEGSILLNAKRYRCGGISGARRQGLLFLGDNPTENLMVPRMSVLDNVGLMLWPKTKLIWFRGDYQRSVRAVLAETCGEDLWDIYVDQLTPVQAQKLVYGKCLLFNPSVVVCVNPFTGMDYQVDDVTEQMMRRLLDKGIAVLVVASYLPAMDMKGETLYLVDGRLAEGEKQSGQGSEEHWLSEE